MFYEKLWFRKWSTVLYSISLIFMGVMFGKIGGGVGAYTIAGLSAGFCGFNIANKFIQAKNGNGKVD